MKAVVYARYSSDNQRAESIEAQLRACREYASKQGYVVVGEYCDQAVSGTSAKTVKRREYQRMLRDAEKGMFDVILAHKHDRLARSLQEHVNLEKRLDDVGVQLIAVAQDFGSSNEAKIIKTLMWSLSEFYSDNLSSEVKKGHKENALQGLSNGGVPPFGYDAVDRQLVVNEFEAAYVRRMFDNALNRRGHTELIKEMGAAGVVGKRGRPIQYTQIYEILRNEKYAGVYIYSQNMAGTRAERRTKPDAIRIQDAHPAIVDRATFDEVQKIMNERKQTGNSKGRYMCSGLVYCECGKKMWAMSPTRKGHTYQYYTCSAKCGAPTVKVEDVDAAAIDYLRELLDEENQQITADALRAYQDGELSRLAEFYDGLKSRVGEKKRRYENLMTTLATGAVNADVVAAITNEMASLQEEIAALEDSTPPPDFTVDQIKAWLEAIKAAPDEKAVHLLIERIDVKQTEQKTEFEMRSTLNSVLGKHGRGDRI